MLYSVFIETIFSVLAHMNTVAVGPPLGEIKSYALGTQLHEWIELKNKT